MSESETILKDPKESLQSERVVFYKTFESVDPFTQEPNKLVLTYTFTKDKFGMRVGIKNEYGVEIGFLSVSGKSQERIINSVNKTLDKRSLPFEFQNVRGVMTFAQKIMNEQLQIEGFSQISTVISKDRIPSVLSRLRATRSDGTYPKTTITVEDETRYRVITDLSQSMTTEEVEQATQELLKAQEKTELKAP